MKKCKDIKEIKVLKKDFEKYLKLKKQIRLFNLDIVMYLDKTAYNSMVFTEYSFTKKIDKLFITLNEFLEKGDFKSYFDTKIVLDKKIEELSKFLNENKQYLKFILNHLKIKNSKVRS